MSSKHPGFIIGTAGHIDHGKSALVKALTDIDTDRLAEEKKRGISIELGFAHYFLSDQTPVGIVDVPGHEKFVPTMVSGVLGMDLVLLVVNALEGFRAQTLEHLDILSFLGVKTGIIVFTHCDQLDETLTELAIMDMEENVSGTFLEQAPKLFVSSTEGTGIPELKTCIEDMLLKCHPRDSGGVPFLPVDRCFSLKGIGTVVTGSLISGSITKGQEYFIFPGNRKVRVKNLQCYGKNRTKAIAGNRTAINLAGVHYEEVKRGHVLCAEGSGKPSGFLNVQLTASSLLNNNVKTRSLIRFYSGTNEQRGQLFFIGSEKELAPGSDCFAQIRLFAPVYFTAQMPFLLRLETPVVTLGGGKILEGLEERKSLNKINISHLENLFCEKEETIFLDPLNSYPEGAYLNSEFHLPEDKNEIFNRLLTDEELFQTKSGNRVLIITGKKLKALFGTIEKVLQDFHKKNPHRLGLLKAHLISKMRIKDSKKGGMIMSLFCKLGWLLQERNKFFLVNFSPHLNPAEKNVCKKLLSFLDEQKFSPQLKQFKCPVNIELKKIIEHLWDREELIQIKENFFLKPSLILKAKKLIELHLQKHDGILVQDARNILKSSRKYVIPFLEYLDLIEFTRRQGDRRYLHCTQKNG
ncbi:selenocysteine-specific translation elongation factor [Candidatus Riflebacteria bacterium]